MTSMAAIARRAADRARTAPGGARDLALAQTPPPADLAHLTGRIGAAATLALIEAHGGTRVAIPKSVSANSRLAQLLGVEAAAALAKWRGGETLKVPVARSWRIRLYRAEGLSYAAIAKRLGCTESTVHTHLSGASLTRQMDLGL